MESFSSPKRRVWVSFFVYHPLLGSHLLYGAQLWGQGNCVNQNNIQNLQNRALRKITFKKFHDPVNPLYKDLKILKFKDLLHLQNCLFVLQIEQNQKQNLL